MWRRDISIAARSRLQSGDGGDHRVGHVVADPFRIGILAAAERVEDVALGEDSRARLFLVDDDRGADAALGHPLGGVAQGVASADRQDHPGHALTNLHLLTSPPGRRALVPIGSNLSRSPRGSRAAAASDR